MHSPSQPEKTSQLQRALAAVEKMQAKLHQVAAAKHEPIAIVGLGCRLPSGIHSPEAFWEFLCAGGDAICEIPESRWDWKRYFDEDRQAAGKMYVKHGGFLDTLYDFDCDFFGISPKEAARMDPQQRLILETAWEALENAGIAPDQLAGSQTGVFVAISGIDAVIDIFSDTSAVDPYMGTGTVHSIASGRLSYVLGLKGPSMCLDTACSSSLLAHHVAVQSLRSGECDMALVGGVNMIHRPELNLTFCNGGMLAPDGHCKTFDEAANGYVRSEGCGFFVLKRLSDARAAGDRIYAQIRGTALNHDGITSGLTVPNGPSQQAVIRTALKNARLNPDQIGYIEAHGTGTPLGDPIELGALDAVFSNHRTKPLWVGSVKTNIGHLEAGAGAAGMMKAVLSLYHQKIPAHLHYKNPSQRFDWDRSVLRVPTQLTDWPQDLPKAAGVSAFSFSGTNAHIILTADDDQASPLPDVASVQTPILLALSAKTKPALQQLAGRLGKVLEDPVVLNDVAYTMHLGRATFSHRLALVAPDREALQQKLQRFADHADLRGAFYGYQERAKKVVFLYPGQGMQHHGMGRELYAHEPVFREKMDHCAAIADAHLPVPLLEVIYGEKVDDTLISETQYTQPALFALGVSLAHLWHSWGIQPDAYFGQSMGEITAAHLAGVFSLEDGMRLALERGRLMGQLPPNGLMAAIGAEEHQISEVLTNFEQVSMAAINGSYGIVISGLREQVETVCEIFKARDVKCSPLDVSIASHCPLMQPIADAYGAVARSLTYTPPQRPLIADLTGTWADASIATPEYWVRHILEPVRFADCIQTLHRDGYRVFIENGPTPLLLAMARQILDDESAALIAPLQKGKDAHQQALEACGQLFTTGHKPDWQAFHRLRPGARISLPSYPFQHRQDWVPSYASFGNTFSGDAPHPLVDGKLIAPLLSGACYESHVTNGIRPLVEHHLVFNHRVLAAAALISALHAVVTHESGSHQVCFQDLRLLAPLVIGEEHPVRIQFGWRRDGETERVSVISFAADDTRAANTQGHVEAVRTALPTLPPTCDLDTLKASFSQTQAGENLYLAQEQRGIRLTGPYRQLRTLYLDQNSALGQVDVPAQGGGSGWPTESLDACFQVLVAALGPVSQAVWLPQQFEEIAFFSDPPGTLWAHAEISDPPSVNATTFTGNLTVYSDNGAPLARFKGVHGARVEADHFRRYLEGHQQVKTYEAQWLPCPLSAAEIKLKGRWLVLADEVGYAETWLKGIGKADSFQPLFLRHHSLSDATVSSPDSSWRNPCQTVFESFSPEEELAGILHFWSLDFQGDACEPMQVIRTLLGPIHYAFQTLRQPPQELHFFTSAAVATHSEKRQELERVGAMAQSALWGFGRSLALEYPDLTISMQDFDAATLDALDGHVHLDSEEPQLAWREGAALAARLVERQATKPKPLRVKADASYLITGGLGALGMALGQRLIDRGATSLVLVGRSQPGEVARQKLEAWRQRGIQITHLRADLARPEGAEQIRNLCGQLQKPLSGVAHVAGILRDGTLASLEWQQFLAPLEVKVNGAMALHHILQTQSLDFFLCFSSATGLLGSAGQTNYGAANAFLDGFAHWRTGQGCPALSIGWGAWEGDGLANQAHISERLARMGITPMVGEAALNAMESLIQTQAAYAMVTQTNWSTYAKSRDVGLTFFQKLLSKGTASNRSQDWMANWQVRLKDLMGKPRAQAMVTYLQEQLAEVLGWDENRQPSPDLSLPELGLDSLMGIRLKNKIAQVVGWAPRIVDFIKAPSLEQLAIDIARQSQPSGMTWGAPVEPLDPTMEELVL